MNTLEISGLRRLSDNDLEPIHQQDAAVLSLADGAIFTEATLPSGTVIPEAETGMAWFVRDGNLSYENSTPSQRTKGTKIVNDEEIPDSIIMRDRVELSKEALRNVIERVCQINLPETVQGVGLENAVTKACQKLDPLFGRALAIVHLHYQFAKKGKQGGANSKGKYSNRKELISALKILNARYGKTIEVAESGKVVGVLDNGHRLGDVRAYSEFKGQERIDHIGVVVRASRKHGGLGSGTERVTLKDLKSGQISLKVPWGLEEQKNKKR